MSKKHPLVWGALCFVFGGGCLHTGQDVWLQVLPPEASHSSALREYVYFGPLTQVGAGALWERSSSGGVSLRWPSDLKQQRAIGVRRQIVCTNASIAVSTKSGMTFAIGALGRKGGAEETALDQAVAATLHVDTLFKESLTEKSLANYISMVRDSAYASRIKQPNTLVATDSIGAIGYSITFSFASPGKMMAAMKQLGRIGWSESTISPDYFVVASGSTALTLVARHKAYLCGAMAHWRGIDGMAQDEAALPYLSEIVPRGSSGVVVQYAISTDGTVQQAQRSFLPASFGRIDPELGVSIVPEAPALVAASELPTTTLEAVSPLRQLVALGIQSSLPDIEADRILSTAASQMARLPTSFSNEEGSQGYAVSVSNLSEKLSQLSTSGVSADMRRSSLRFVAEDINVKVTFGDSHPDAPTAKIKIKIHTADRGGKDVSNLWVMYVQAILSDDPSRTTRCPNMSSPAEDQLYAGLYYIWATNNPNEAAVPNDLQPVGIGSGAEITIAAPRIP